MTDDQQDAPGGEQPVPRPSAAHSAPDFRRLRVRPAASRGAWTRRRQGTAGLAVITSAGLELDRRPGSSAVAQRPPRPQARDSAPQAGRRARPARAGPVTAGTGVAAGGVSASGLGGTRVRLAVRRSGTRSARPGPDGSGGRGTPGPSAAGQRLMRQISLARRARRQRLALAMSGLMSVLTLLISGSAWVLTSYVSFQSGPRRRGHVGHAVQRPGQHPDRGRRHQRRPDPPPGTQAARRRRDQLELRHPHAGAHPGQSRERSGRQPAARFMGEHSRATA